MKYFSHDLGAPAMYCLLEVVAVQREKLAPQFLKNLDWIKVSLNSKVFLFVFYMITTMTEINIEFVKSLERTKKMYLCRPHQVIKFNKMVRKHIKSCTRIYTLLLTQSFLYCYIY